MLKKPSIVYGRKKVELPNQFLPEPDHAVANLRNAAINSVEKAVKQHNVENPQNYVDKNLLLYNSSLESSEVTVPAPKKEKKIIPKGRKAKPKKTEKKSTLKTINTEVAKEEWSKADTYFKEFENYALAETMEKSNALSEANDHVENEVPHVEVHVADIPLENMTASNVKQLASTPAVGLSNDPTFMTMGSDRASPVISPSTDDPIGDDIEHVGNAKLPTPKLPPGINLHSLRLTADRIRKMSESSSISCSLSKRKSRKREDVVSLCPSSNPVKDSAAECASKPMQTSVHQKSVRFAENSQSSNSSVTGNEMNASKEKSLGDSSFPSRIERSADFVSFVNFNLNEMGLHESPTSSASVAIISAVPIAATIDGFELDGSEFRLAPSAFSVAPEENVSDWTQSVMPHNESALHNKTPVSIFVQDDASNQVNGHETTSPDVIPEKLVSKPSPIILSPQTEHDENEQDDVVGDLVAAAKNVRFPRKSLPGNSTGVTSLFDLSMRRKSSLVHEVTVDHSSTNEHALDDPEAFSLSRLTILTPVKARRTQFTFSPLEKLLRACGQNSVLPFENFFDTAERNSCVKIGEGVSGEVFKISVPENTARVIKIIPVDGAEPFNDAPQKSFVDILAEVVIAKKTSSFASAADRLHDGTSADGPISRSTRSRRNRESAIRSSLAGDKTTNASPNFIAVNQIRVVQGPFPPFLLQLWDSFDKLRGSENDRPDKFEESQHYLIFDSVFGGSPLESSKFSTALDTLSCFCQVAVSLAVGETATSFEHRDLHWGNILVRPTKRERLEYRIGSKRVSLPSAGYEVAIIDFTLSRCSEDGIVVWTNLSQDEGIFQGEGDFQFEVYRLMRKETKDNWAAYTPRTNAFWLWYLADKLVNKVVYSQISKPNVQHRKSLKVLKDLLKQVKNANSATSFVWEELIPRASAVFTFEQ